MVQKRAIHWLVLAIVVAALPVLSACNTTEGVGRDISAAGRGISGAADDSRPRR